MTNSVCDIEWSQAFAILLPISTNAHEMLRARSNRRQRRDASLYGMQTRQDAGRRRRFLIKLDFAMLLGRRCVTFGSSQATNIRFPVHSDVAEYHFFIQFDYESGALRLIDTSCDGTLISDTARFSATSTRTLHEATHTLGQSTFIRVGGKTHYDFQLLLRKVPSFQRLFGGYLRSIGEAGNRRSSVLAGEIRRASTSSQETASETKTT